MVIEELTITIDPVERDQFLDLDQAIWTPFLAAQSGFVRKEVWLPEGRPDTIVLVIHWTSMTACKAITPDQVVAVDAKMGRFAEAPLVCRAYQVHNSTPPDP
jgi:uncharacterized protein (TIGR03792 family)